MTTGASGNGDGKKEEEEMMSRAREREVRLQITERCEDAGIYKEERSMIIQIQTTLMTFVFMINTFIPSNFRD